jgi:hypothetical protein
MARYIITTRRNLRGSVPSAHDVVAADPRVKILNSNDPQMVTVEANEEAADELQAKLKETHFVEPEIRRGLT